MLLQSVKVKNSRGSLLNLSLEDPSSGFVIKEIEGLEPVKATLVSSSFANQDGEQYHSSRREPRDIKIKLGLEPDFTLSSVQALRSQLYNFFMPKTKVTLSFHLFDKFIAAQGLEPDSLDLDIEARIEDFDAPLFTKEPEAIISLRCFKPDFVDPIPRVFNGTTVSDLTETVLTYAGSIETGVIFKLLIDRVLTDFAIYHTPPDGSLRTVNVSYPFVAGDVFERSSIIGSKSVLLTRAGVTSSILYAVTPQSSWLELQPGDNSLRVYAAGAAIPFSVEYTNKYGGL